MAMRHILLLLSVPAFASDSCAQGGSLLGADLYYEHVGGLEWSFTVRTYVDPFVPVETPDLYVMVGDAVDTIAGTTQEIVISNCLEQLQPVVYTWSRVFPGPGIYSLKAWKNSRKLGYNLPGGSDQVLCLSTDLLVTPGLQNNSPVFGNQQGTLYADGSALVHDPLLSDADADSLACFAMPLMGQGCQPIQGFSDPASSTPPGDDLQVHPSTGVVTWTTPSTTGDFWFAFTCQEYRGGELIGSVTRDMRICVQELPMNLVDHQRSGFSIFQESLDGPVTIMNENDRLVLIELLDARGALLRRLRPEGPTTVMTTDHMMAGVYFVKVTSDAGTVRTGSFLVSR